MSKKDSESTNKSKYQGQFNKIVEVYRPPPLGGGTGCRPLAQFKLKKFKSAKDEMNEVMTKHHNDLKMYFPALMNDLYEQFHYSGLLHKWFYPRFYPGFDQFDIESKSAVVQTYDYINHGIHSQELVYSPSKQEEGCYGYSIKPNKIYLTRGFRDAPYEGTKSGENSQRQILVHEMSHLYGDTVDYEIGEEGNYSIAKLINKSSDIPDSNPPLTPEQCQDLAAREPHKAIRNADNYGFFFDEYIMITKSMV